jgi:hypothetical protein
MDENLLAQLLGGKWIIDELGPKVGQPINLRNLGKCDNGQINSRKTKFGPIPQ